MTSEEKIKSKIDPLSETFCGIMQFSPGFYFVFSRRENLIAPFLVRGFHDDDFYKGKFEFIAFDNLNTAKNLIQNLMLARFFG